MIQPAERPAYYPETSTGPNRETIMICAAGASFSGLTVFFGHADNKALPEDFF